MYKVKHTHDDEPERNTTEILTREQLQNTFRWIPGWFLAVESFRLKVEIDGYDVEIERIK